MTSSTVMTKTTLNKQQKISASLGTGQFFGICRDERFEGNRNNGGLEEKIEVIISKEFIIEGRSQAFGKINCARVFE